MSKTTMWASMLLLTAVLALAFACSSDKSDKNEPGTDGDEVTTDGDEETADGDEVTTDGDEVTADGDEVTTDGDEVTTDGDEVTTDGDEVTTDGDEVVTDGDGGAESPAGIGGLKIRFAEEGEGAPTNIWIFPAGSETSGSATLEGVADFPFTYEKTGASTSVIIFDVGGSDRYDMVWTSATGGTFQESFNGTPGNPGAFTIIE